MGRHLTRTIGVLLCTLWSMFLAAQNPDPGKVVHKAKLGYGIGTSEYFSGVVGTFSYEAHRKSYFLLASFNHLLEFQIFSQQLEHQTDLSVTMNRAFHKKWFELSGGIGVAYTRHLFDIYNIYKPEPGMYIPDEYRYVRKGTIGLPVDVQVTGNFKRFTISLVSHSNFNSQNTMHCFYMMRVGMIFR